ncbi:MAG: hypothetical protein ACRDTD_28910, partial [Pseudonocardiaceae bacterium]
MVAAAAVIALTAVTLGRVETVHQTVWRTLQRVGYLWIALMLYLLVWLLATELVRPAIAAAARRYARRKGTIRRDDAS